MKILRHKGLWKSKIVKSTEEECWLFQGYHYKGYPKTYNGVTGQQEAVHRLIYEEKYGPIPLGLKIHHKCENTWCVNLKHMELLTEKEHQEKHKKKPRGINLSKIRHAIAVLDMVRK
jgi:hypothetical protein